MINFIDECVGCPPEMGCLGITCPNRHIPVLVCDYCNEEPDELYLMDGEQLCSECLQKRFEKITYSNWRNYSQNEGDYYEN